MERVLHAKLMRRRSTYGNMRALIPKKMNKFKAAAVSSATLQMTPD
jgi:hypothetical protein